MQGYLWNNLQDTIILYLIYVYHKIICMLYPALGIRHSDFGIWEQARPAEFSLDTQKKLFLWHSHKTTDKLFQLVLTDVSSSGTLWLIASSAMINTITLTGYPASDIPLLPRMHSLLHAVGMENWKYGIKTSQLETASKLIMKISTHWQLPHKEATLLQEEKKMLSKFGT